MVAGMKPAEREVLLNALAAGRRQFGPDPRASYGYRKGVVTLAGALLDHLPGLGEKAGDALEEVLRHWDR